MPAGRTPEPRTPRQAVGRDDKSLVQRFPGPIAYWDSDLRHVVSSHVYQAHYGIDSATIRGAHLREVLGADSFATALPGIQSALAGDRQVVRLASTDPTLGTRWTAETYEPDVVEGEVCGIYVSLVDVTRDVQVQRLSDHAQRLAGLGSWTTDPRTRAITWSEEMYHIMGYDPETFTPDYEALVARLHRDDAERVRSAVRQAVETGGNHDLDYRIVRTDGEVREVNSRVHGERDTDGNLVMLYGTVQDLTARQVLLREMARMNEQLQQLNQLHEDVLGVLGHDVRLPLTVVLGQLETTLDAWETMSVDMGRHRVERALAAARRLLALCNNILALARSVNGALEAVPARVEVPEVVVEALHDLDRAAAVALEVDHAPPPAQIDPIHLRQMIVNLVNNAFRYGAEPVGVSVTQHDATVVVEVTDCGPGVPPEFVPHLFERFTRAASETATGETSSGFGLYVVQRLAEANRATVEYLRHHPRGSRFRVSLPVAPD